MIQRNKHIIAYLLLASILTVCFPIQEFFHDHHSSKEVCERQSQHTCKHSKHIGKQKVNIGCHFCLLHKAFTSQNFHFTIIVPEVTHSFTLISKSYQNTEKKYASRGPPMICNI